MKNTKIKNGIYLISAALIWGTAFVFQSKGNEYMQPFTFFASRSFLGFLVLLPFSVFKTKKCTSEDKTKSKASFKVSLIGGLCCGIALTVASLLQQYGMIYTTVGKAGFITALYIIITPILGTFIKKKCPFTVWVGALVAVIGMYLLCVSESFTVSKGDVLVFLCAVVFSIQILEVDYFSPKTDGVVLSCIQFLVCFVLSFILAMVFDKPDFTQIIDGIIPVLYAGIMSSGVAYTFQILGQKNFNPTVAAMILSLEAVISTVAGYAAYYMGFLTQDQSLTSTQIIGCVIVFVAVIFAQIPFDNLKIRK